MLEGFTSRNSLRSFQKKPYVGANPTEKSPILSYEFATIEHWQAQLAVTQPSLEDLQVQLLLVALASEGVPCGGL
jgi:hypothetical protein